MKNMKQLEEVQEIVDYLEEIVDGKKLSLKEMYEIALRLQDNRIKEEYNLLYSIANVLEGELTPSALEKIAMELSSMSQEGIVYIKK